MRKFPWRIRTIVSRKFSRRTQGMNADSEISHVTDARVYVCTLQIKHAVACTWVYTVCLHMEQAFKILPEEMKLEETFHFITRIKYWSSFEHTVAFANREYNHAMLWVLVKLSRNQWPVNLLFSVLWDSILDSILDSLFSIRAGIVNRVENQDSQWTVNLLLKGTVGYLSPGKTKQG